LAKYGSVIRNHTRQLTELVNQILLFAANKEGRTHYVFRPLQVPQIIDAVLRNTRETVEQAGFVVEPQLEPDLPEIVGDASALTQCLQNLVGNAVKYGGNHLRVAIRAFVHKRHDHHDEICVSVEDRGIGIDSSEIPHIFDPFYRSPVVAAAQIHGTGLGLTLAKNIAEAMGGSLTVVSKLGVGSVFTLHLPIRKKTNELTPIVQSGSLTRP
jgi:signal transduction histidine kinase